VIVPRSLSIVIAVQHAQGNLPDIIAALRPAAYPDVEFIFCHTPADPWTSALVGVGENIRVLHSQPGSLIPTLWRDGIVAALGEKVATTTAHCIPEADWVERLASANLKEVVGVGGTIGNASQSDAKGWAILMLRYSAFSLPQAPREVNEIAADNALYRRRDILRHADLLARGFWEPSFHARFRAEGLRLCLDPALRVTHRNRYTAAQFAIQRLAHGYEFGFSRGSALPMSKRLRLTLLSPGVPVVLLRRIMAAIRDKPVVHARLPRAFFWLTAFLLSWSAGEAIGYIATLFSSSHEGGIGAQVAHQSKSGGDA
jgi:hypothetical protein